ncbi:MAG: hypothetical protein JNK78_19180 [Planctomycetes bacterium]|nr:hypothetical protein [Planctomycetota bacterium]
MRHFQESSLRDDRAGERGVALILGIMFTVIVVGITVTGALVMRAHQQQTKVSFVAHGQAVQFARSGLIEALGWCRKQTSQPVTAFAPQLDTASTPPILETIDPDIGLVREFQITNSIWGRYEVWKPWPGDPDAARSVWRTQMECEDVSGMRGNLSPGSIWRIRSLGYVFQRVDPNRAFNVAPNHVIGQEMVEVEARRLALQPPGQAAVCSRVGGSVSVQTRGRIIGGSVAAGIYYLNGTGTPSVSGTGSSVTGTPNQSAATTYADGFEEVFGVSQTELTAMADYVITNAADFPSPVPVDTLVFSTVGMTFTAAKPLKGTGVVAIVGNTTIGAGSYSAFSGLLYVQGNLTIREPSEIQGAVVVTGTITVQGASDYATVTYDDTILAHLRQELGTYRLSSAVARPMAQDR